MKIYLKQLNKNYKNKIMWIQIQSINKGLQRHIKVNFYSTMITLMFHPYLYQMTLFYNPSSSKLYDFLIHVNPYKFDSCIFVQYSTLFGLPHFHVFQQFWFYLHHFCFWSIISVYEWESIVHLHVKSVWPSG